jgi:hypothetical protein
VQELHDFSGKEDFCPKSPAKGGILRAMSERRKFSDWLSNTANFFTVAAGVCAVIVGLVLFIIQPHGGWFTFTVGLLCALLLIVAMGLVFAAQNRPQGESVGELLRGESKTLGTKPFSKAHGNDLTPKGAQPIAKAEPNLKYLRWVRFDAEFDDENILRPSLKGHKSILAEFINKEEQGRQVGEIDRIKAVITYQSAQERITETYYSHWLNEQYVETSFWVGRTQRLLIGMELDDGLHAVENRQEKPGRHYPSMRMPLGAERYLVDVKLTDNTGKEFNFYFTLQCKPALELQVRPDPTTQLLMAEGAKNNKPDIKGQIKEVFFGKGIDLMSTYVISNHVYDEFDFTVRVYLSNHGATTTIESFKFVLKSDGSTHEGEIASLKDSYIRRPNVADEKLIDANESNDVPLDHTRNGWLRFKVNGVREIKNEAELEIELYAIDKYGIPHRLDGLPQSRWIENSWRNPERGRIVHMKDADF